MKSSNNQHTNKQADKDTSHSLACCHGFPSPPFCHRLVIGLPPIYPPPSPTHLPL